MSPTRVFTVLVSMGLVACVTQIEDLTDEERAQLSDSSAALDDEIGVSQQALKTSDYDKAKADRLGQRAASGAGAHSKHACYHYVKQAIAGAGFTLPASLSTMTYGNSAADFIKFGAQKRDELDKMGLQHVGINRGETHPQGTITVYPRGNCGYSPLHGHIEIVCDSAGQYGCSDFRGHLGALRACATPTYFLPKGTTSTSESCTDKEDGYYCSAVSPNSAYKCTNHARGTAVFCEGASTSSGSSSQSCGTADAKATVSSDGKLTCSASSTGSSSSSSSSGDTTSGGTSGGTSGESGSSSGDGTSGSSSGFPSLPDIGGSAGEPTPGDSGNASSPEGNWTCPGITGKVIPSDGTYWMTTFGASDATQGTTCDDAGDNCIGACNAQAAQQGFCSQSEVNKPAICERNAKWFVADADRYGCGSRVKVEMNGKAVVALVIDRGPNCRIERQKSAAVLDASPAVNTYLSGRAQNGVGGAQVHVTEVVGDTPLGPVN